MCIVQQFHGLDIAPAFAWEAANGVLCNAICYHVNLLKRFYVESGSYSFDFDKIASE